MIGILGVFRPAYRNAPADVMPEQPAGVALPAPITAPPNSTNPTQPGVVR